MVKLCCVKRCNSEAYAGSGISFFSFPKKEDLREKWLKSVPFKNKYSNNSCICSRHFKSDDVVIHMVKSTLKPDAVPCIFPVDVILEPAQENIPADNTSKLQLSDKYLTTNIDVLKSDYMEPNSDTSIEDPLKTNRCEENLKNSISEQNKLKYRVKLLSQRLKTRNKKIKQLKTVLNIIKKKS